MGVMLATIWIRLGTEAGTINDRLSVHFYSVAFLSFSKWVPDTTFVEYWSIFPNYGLIVDLLPNL